ncbi:MAG: 4-hydroxythreonine-4-phosphate dehydrogenase PdxA [Candidatus Protistobacter heckmanni]|nr:4-hydroxythreonine-4-phosphate dehydrogenase PdxA [Candidatus Protistobacter heckmanni]
MSTIESASADLLAITTGEPAGFGSDISIQALVSETVRARLRVAGRRCAVLGDAALFGERARAVGLADAWRRTLEEGAALVEPFALRAPCKPGQLDPANAAYVLELLDAALAGCANGRYTAMVNAPLKKSTIATLLLDFSGHTEYLAEKTGAKQVVMMLAGPIQGGRMLRVALATTHLPLNQVSAAITREGLLATLRVVDTDLRRRFGIAKPAIIVTGLNPHAGEEKAVIEPAIAAARIDARGPYPADTLFQPRHLDGADCVLAMYHDQGLAPLKYATFGQGVNVTLGLPIVRTSVDYGTALDLAATGRADAGSMVQAISVALEMCGAGT